jgi:hypothetical protein
VVVSGLQLAERKEAETRLVAALRRKHVDAVEAIALFPPTRELTAEEISAALRERGFDGVLHAQRLESGTKVQTGWLAGLASAAGSTTVDTPEPYTTFDLSLTDLGSGQVVWVASTRTEGSSYASNGDLLESFASRTADELEDGRLLASRGAVRE